MKKILVLGAAGQIGTDLTIELRKRFGNKNVIAADLQNAAYEIMQAGGFEYADVLNKSKIESIVDKYQITEIYHLAAILSAKGEEKPKLTWNVNMNGLFNVLELARKKKIQKVFWPSSIAVFGPTTPKENTPQDTITMPNTVYGISKFSGERWIEYFNEKYGLDVRSVRYPGIISYKTKPGGGVTDYAVEMYHDAVTKNEYVCFLKEDARLPMMYMDDAIKVTIELMEVDKSQLTLHTSYNVASMSFSPKDVENEIKKHKPDFKVNYKPDHRQKIADTWPHSIDDSIARQRDGWQPDYDLKQVTEIMLREFAKQVYKKE